MYASILCPVDDPSDTMAATTPTTEVPSVTAVSSPSARRLYYELVESETATVDELAETLDHETDRVESLLTVLASHDLVAEADGHYRV